MKKAITYLLFSFFIQAIWSQPIPAKLTHTIIIDTDCGFDDMRAISLLLARPEVTIKAILTSDGTLPPSEGAAKVCSLLHEFDRDNIPVAAGEPVKGINPPWREFNRSLRWGREKGNQDKVYKGTDYLSTLLSEEKEKITLVCLGSLTSIANTFRKDPRLMSKIDRIIWYNESARPSEGFNYECDKESADYIFKTKARIDVISNLKKSEAIFDISLNPTTGKQSTQLAQILQYVFNQQNVNGHTQPNHSRLSDDLVALYITNPELFGINTSVERLNVRYNQDYDASGIKEAISDMIKGIYVTEHNVVFNRFPVQREMFNYDIRPIIDSAIARYGYDEWKANVMTDEFHGHLGVFSIVGAKMGIKARDLFGVGPDMLVVETFAGQKPPYSCLTDGIQVSTGATLGMGTIHLAADTVAKPQAVFTYKNQSYRITLKKEYLDQVDADINEGIVKFGLMDDGYWKLVRQNALKYWLEWDRNEIFDIEKIK